MLHAISCIISSSSLSNIAALALLPVASAALAPGTRLTVSSRAEFKASAVAVGGEEGDGKSPHSACIALDISAPMTL